MNLEVLHVLHNPDKVIFELFCCFLEFADFLFVKS